MGLEIRPTNPPRSRLHKTGYNTPPPAAEVAFITRSGVQYFFFPPRKQASQGKKNSNYPRGPMGKKREEGGASGAGRAPGLVPQGMRKNTAGARFGVFFFFPPKLAKSPRLRPKLQPLGSTLNLQWTRRRGQWAQPMPIKFTTTSTGGRKKKEEKKIICKFSGLHTHSQGGTHTCPQAHKRQERVGAGCQRGKGDVSADLSLDAKRPWPRALGEGAREARPGPSAMMVAAVRSPFFLAGELQ